MRSLYTQSADTCFQALPDVAESAYLSRFLRWGLPTVSGCCALSGVRSGVSTPSCAVPSGAPYHRDEGREAHEKAKATYYQTGQRVGFRGEARPLPGHHSPGVWGNRDIGRPALCDHVSLGGAGVPPKYRRTSVGSEPGRG